MIPVRVLIFHKCITALEDYQHKSLEELRWEDYQIGRKTARPQTTTASTTRPTPPLINNSSSASMVMPMPSTPAFNFRFQLPNNIFSSSASASASVAINPNTMGTFLKFQPILGADIKDFRNGSGFVAIDTRLMSIVAMLEYERKSPEELRWEDYQCNRKVSRTPIAPGRLFRSLPLPSAPKPADETATTSTNAQTTNAEIDASCPICLETIQDLKKQNKRLMSTICGHILCKVCATSLIRTSRKIECPTCRKLLLEKDIHNLFL